MSFKVREVYQIVCDARIDPRVCEGAGARGVRSKEEAWSRVKGRGWVYDALHDRHTCGRCRAACKAATTMLAEVLKPSAEELRLQAENERLKAELAEVRRLAAAEEALRCTRSSVCRPQ